MTFAAPRSLCGPVNAMARPARPQAERIAVLKAAALVRGETGLRANAPVAREIAKRVMAAFLADLDRGDDALAQALVELEQRIAPCPIVTLAVSAEINLAGEFLERRVVEFRARDGSYAGLELQRQEKKRVADRLSYTLFRRYLGLMRHSRAIEIVSQKEVLRQTSLHREGVA